MEKQSSAAPSLVSVAEAYSSKANLAYHGSRDLDPYVPAEHRPKHAQTSSLGALAHLLKASLGSGVLAMPLAFKNAGLIVGLIGTIFIGTICAHAIYILVWTSQALCIDEKKPSLNYAETCQLVFERGPKHVKKFASFSRELADWTLALTHLGACCVYIVVIAESFKQISDQYGGPPWSVGLFCALTMVVLIPMTQITKLKYLVPFSAIANFVWLASIGICMYYSYRNVPKLEERNFATSITGIPTFISTCLFAMEGIGVVMPLENEMTKPKQFLGCPGVLNIAMLLVVCLYSFVGFSGYIAYGEVVRGSLTLNLPEDEVLAQVAKILVACVMVLSYALVFYVPVDVVWRKLEPRLPANRQTLSMALLRLFGCLFTVGIATAVPRLELFMELVGAVCLSTMGLFIPAAVQTIYLWDKKYKYFIYIIIKNSIIAIISLVAMVSGVTYALKDL